MSNDFVSSADSQQSDEGEKYWMAFHPLNS